MKTIRCQHCGETQTTTRPDLRLYCDTCRAIRQIRALALSTQKCKLCRSAFYPVDQKHARGKVCTACSGTPAGVTTAGKACAYCDRRDGLLPGLKLCYRCCENPSEKRHAAIQASLRTAYEKRAAPPPSDPAIAA